MIRFNNDYNRGAHPAILAALSATNDEPFEGYGLDPWCEAAAREILKYLDEPERARASVHFLVGGTQTNVTVISALLRPWQSVVSAHSGHINVHETGAVEHSGHKVEALPAQNGKISAEQVAAVAEGFRVSDIPEHITQPKMVYISLPTEVGSVYTRAELEALRAVCDEYSLILFIDGARLSYGLASPACDLTLADIARLTDVFYIGGTKCGALFGEAVVFTNPALACDFRSAIKQNGGMLAKGWLLGLQFHTLFRDGLYFRIAESAISQAMRIRDAFAAAGVPAYAESPTNQQFVVLTEEQMRALGQKYIYEYEAALGEGRHAVRFCTSWSTSDADVDALVADIAAL
ncbi:MAG: aminotransferase class I/II-fold pyridoxal phosphate-dependent enzyme [Eggerthellaceae bacterium]|nr:aminotransferase class I/II-fold pyridoxal phosphate-dependent enzyme [Eggerthellaceae bacterium]